MPYNKPIHHDRLARTETTEVQEALAKLCPLGKDDPLYEPLSAVLFWKPEVTQLLLDDVSADPYGVPMANMASAMLAFHACKDAQYGRSWAKRGEAGVYHNFMRKEDRLEQIERMAVVSMLIDDDDPLGDNVHVSLIDNLVDRALYGMMWVSFIARTRRRAFLLWLERSWCPATGATMDDALAMLGMADVIEED